MPELFSSLRKSQPKKICSGLWELGYLLLLVEVKTYFVCVSSDISGSPVSVDVGMCRSHCGATSPRPSHEAVKQQEYSKHASMLEFLKSKKVSDDSQHSH